MKRLLLFFIVILTMCQNANAYDFKVGGLYYNVISSADLTVEVTSQYDTWHRGTRYYYQGYRNGSAFTGSAYFRPGYYDYFDIRSDYYADSRGNRFSDEARTHQISCTDPYGNINIPSTVTYLGVTFNVIGIGQNAFYGCRYLTQVDIPSSISTIGDSAFYKCSGLTTVFAHNVTSIGYESFGECTSLTTVIMEGNLSNIGNMAFNGCVLLTSLHLDNTQAVPIVGSNALTSIPAYAQIYVPCASISVFQQDEFWSRFTHFHGVGAAGEINLSVNDTLRGRIDIEDTADCYIPETIHAIANYGYHFSAWNDGNTNNPRTVTIESDTSMLAIFDKNTYYVRGLSASNAMGNVAGSDSALYLDTVTLVPVANYGFLFSHWSDGNTDNQRRVPVSRDLIFTAYFDSSLFALQTLSNNAQMGYTRIGSGDYLAAAVGRFKYLSTQTLYATPTEGNQFMQWSDGVTSNPRSVTILNDTSFMATFAPKYVLSVQSANDSMGTVAGHGLFNNHAQAVITAQANYGYHFTNWNDGVTTATRTITITSDTSFTANFARNQYNITATSANQSWGSVIGSARALYGDSVILTATAIGQHHFSYWSDGTNQYTDNPLQVRVTANNYYTAYFEVNQYQVTIFTNGGGNGYVGLGSSNNTGNFDYMTQVTVRAVPYPGNRFAGWSDGIIYNPRAFTITRDTSFTALFAADIYTITVNSNNAVMGSVTGSGIYQADSIAEIAAIPYHAYKFDHWQDNNTSNPRNVTVTANQTYTAYFVTYDTLRIHDTSYIDVFVHDTTVIFITDTLWLHDTVFVHDTIYIHDTTVVGVKEADVLNAKIFSSHGQIIVDGTKGKTVWFYNANGQILATKQDEFLPVHFDIPTSGVYIVKVGELPAQKVVVIK